jgi:hypothetical protein
MEAYGKWKCSSTYSLTCALDKEEALILKCEVRGAFKFS